MPAATYNATQSPKGCLVNHGFWGAYYFANTLYSTIGYGNVYCCSWMGRLLTVMYSFCGIILALICVRNFGKSFSHIVHCTYGRLVEEMKKLRSNILVRQGKFENYGYDINRELEGVYGGRYEEELATIGHDTPSSVGVVLTVGWILLTALFFAYVEGWTYFTALYFTFISLTTIGRL